MTRGYNPGHIFQSRDFGIEIYLIPGFRDFGIQDNFNPGIPGFFGIVSCEPNFCECQFGKFREERYVSNLIIGKHIVF